MFRSTSENTGGEKNGLKMYVIPHKNFHSKYGVKTDCKLGKTLHFSNCPYVGLQMFYFYSLSLSRQLHLVQTSPKINKLHQKSTRSRWLAFNVNGIVLWPPFFLNYKFYIILLNNLYTNLYEIYIYIYIYIYIFIDYVIYFYINIKLNLNYNIF